MLLGLEPLPESEQELIGWANDKNNYRHRCAAIVALAEIPSLTIANIANAAINDPYWQVRMAVAAVEILLPGSLSTASKELLQNDHVYWVRSLLNLWCVSRFADLNLDALKQFELRGTGLVCRIDQQEADDFFTIIKGYLHTSQCDYLFILNGYLNARSLDKEKSESLEFFAEIESVIK
jgi:hypothetical protein